MSPAMALADQARHFLQSKRERRGQIGANDVVDDARSRHRMCQSVIRLRITLDADWGSNGAPTPYPQARTRMPCGTGPGRPPPDTSVRGPLADSCTAATTP